MALVKTDYPTVEAYAYPEVEVSGFSEKSLRMPKEVSPEQRRAMNEAHEVIRQIRTDTLRAQVRLTKDARNRCSSGHEVGQILHAELRKVYHRLSEVLDFPEI